MRLTFPTATIASISGAIALVSTMTPCRVLCASASFAYDEEMRSGTVRAVSSKTQGIECVFVNSFDGKGLYADTGILRCGNGMTCAPDSSSSTGGRCNTVTVQGEKVAAEPQRRLDQGTACTFSNGTFGMKCVGYSACYDADEANIGCGSCIGEYSCLWMGNTTSVGEGSCIGEEACYSRFVREQGTIGPNSCIGELSCARSDEMKVESNSCHGYKSCYDMDGDVTIGSNSCSGDYACRYINRNRFVLYPTPVVIGDYSCRNETHSCSNVEGKHSFVDMSSVFNMNMMFKTGLNFDSQAMSATLAAGEIRHVVFWKVTLP